jgi:hypothetical protein
MNKPYIKWYDTRKRKPGLRIRILKSLATKGNLTKTETEVFFKQKAENLEQATRPHYNEISDAFDDVLKLKFVKFSPNSTRGKSYKLTLEGLKALIFECNSESECWDFIIDFCVHSSQEENLTSYSVFSEVLEAFGERFIPYKSIGTYNYILKIFNIMCRKLSKEIEEDSSVEELLVSLTKKKEMTLAEMESKTRKDKSTIKRIIQMLSMDTANYSSQYTLTGGDDADPENDRRRYIDFLQHCLIFYHDVDGKRYYHLSLFGILFLVNLLINSGISTTSANQSRFQQVLDDIAGLYRKTLPLIFGKWHLLKKYLNLQSVLNFEFVVFSNEQELYNTEELIKLGYETEYDNKLIKNIYPMYASNNSEWDKLLRIGMKKIYDIRKSNFPNFNMMKEYEGNELLNLLHTWGRYLDFRRRLLNIETSIDEIFEGIRTHEKKLAGDIGIDALCHEEDYLLPLKLIETAFEDEVTLIYYLKLMDPCLYPGRRDLQGERETLKQIFTEDEEIRNLLTMFVKDSSNFHESELNNIRTVSDSLELTSR